MAWPWVFALDLGTCIAGLLDDEVGSVTLDHNLDARLFVSGYDDEACAVRRDPVILRRRKLDRLHTPLRRALAMKRK